MSIASEIQRLQGVRTDIFDAITNKGVTVPSGAKLADCPELISLISGGGDNVVIYGRQNLLALDNNIIHPYALYSDYDSDVVRIKGVNLNKNFEMNIRFKYYKSSNAWNTIIGTERDWEIYLEAQLDKAVIRLGNGSSWYINTNYQLTAQLINYQLYDYRLKREGNIITFSYREVGDAFHLLAQIDVSDLTLVDMSNKMIWLGRSNLEHYPINGSYWTLDGGFDLKGTYVKQLT